MGQAVLCAARTRAFGGMLVAVSVGVASLGAAATGLGAASSVWDGVYTEQQASRGQTVYERECATCHLATLQGDGLAPGLVADAFTYRWQDGPVGDLFIVIKATMPADRPSALRDEEYAEVVAYLLKKNNFPAGTGELSKSVDDLKQIKFKKGE